MNHIVHYVDLKQSIRGYDWVWYKSKQSGSKECYAEYEDLPADHPLRQRYDTDMEAWLRREKARPPQPLRLHWHIVAEDGVSAERVRRTWLDGEDALMDGGEPVVTELLRNYLRRKYGDHD